MYLYIYTNIYNYIYKNKYVYTGLSQKIRIL